MPNTPHIPHALAAEIHAAASALRAVFLPLWEENHTERLAAHPALAHYFPTASAVQCTKTVLAMGGASTGRRPEALPGETGFLALGEGRFADRRTRGHITWQHHSWIELDNGLILDLTADQFGHHPITIAPIAQQFTAPKGVMLTNPETPVPDTHIPPQMHYMRAHKPRAADLGTRNTARAWVRRIHADATTRQSFHHALLALRALGTISLPTTQGATT